MPKPRLRRNNAELHELQGEYRQEIVVSAQREIWELAFGAYASPYVYEDVRDTLLSPPDAAEVAAEDLIKLYEAANGMPILDLYELAMTIHSPNWEWRFLLEREKGQRSTGTPFAFGAWLTLASTEGASPSRRDLWKTLYHTTRRGNLAFEPVIPTFRCTYDGDELVWSGEVASVKVGRRSMA